MTSFSEKHRYWQRWEITINGRTKKAVKNAMNIATAPSLGFNLLRINDIFSTSSASTGVEDSKDPIGGMSYGARYKAMWEEMEEFMEPGMIFEIPEGMDIQSSRHIDIIKHTFYKIKQKYFPKEENV